MSTYEHILENCRKRAWCFTINNFTEEEKDKVTQAIRTAKYGIAETEHEDVGEGTPHIQGYIYFEQPKTFGQVKNTVGARAHIEPAKGSPDQNYEYCSKEGNVFVQRPMGKTVGKHGFLEMFMDMKTMDPQTFSDKYPQFWVMHREKALQIMIDNAMKSAKDFGGDLQAKNIWLWGAPGLGKSRWAALQGDYSEILKKNFNKWWDGYSLMETKVVILEDYPCVPAGNTLVQHMKIWGDRYPFTGECKGSHLMVEPRKFFLIITSNYPIDRCFENEEDIRAIKRRFHEVEIRKGDFYNQGIAKLDRSILQ